MDDYDLRALFRAAGAGLLGERALGQSPEVRLDARAEVEMIDERPARVDSPPLQPVGFVDGVQSARTLTHRSHRPVYLTYAAAGVVSPDRRILQLEQQLAVLCSEADSDWVEEAGSRIPVVTVSEGSPDLVASAAARALSSARDRMEILCSSFGPDRTLLLDGGLLGRPVRPGLVGVVKSTSTRYLPDEGVLMGLPRGWRSPRFALKEGFQGCPVRRYCCYVRLLDASRSAWNFGLVRLESFDLDLLEPTAALALSEAQSPFSGDRRYDRHLAGIRMVEETLRAKRPDVFAL